MIDLHCHLLPSIDDGPKSLNDSLAMARFAVDADIEFAVLTPHFNPGRYPNTRTTIETHWRNFQKALEDAEIPLQTRFAAEVRISPDIFPLILENEIPFLGQLDGYNVLLLEFPHSHIPPGSERFTEKLIESGVRPLIAHPERNKDVMRNLSKIEPFIRAGCLLQLTASSVSGDFGPRANARALELLEYEACYAIASDAHNLKSRKPDLRAGAAAAEKVLGPQLARELVYDNPRAIVAPPGLVP